MQFHYATICVFLSHFEVQILRNLCHLQKGGGVTLEQLYCDLASENPDSIANVPIVDRMMVIANCYQLQMN